jgi:rod shape determining protein RodA
MKLLLSIKQLIVDSLLFTSALLLSLIGLLFIFSNSYSVTQPCSTFFIKQLFGIFTGCGLYTLFSLINYRKFLSASIILYPLFVLLLIYTYAKGTHVMGAQRWLSFFGLFRMQPSELAKIILPLITVHYLSLANIDQKYTIKKILFICLLVAPSLVLILLQPDLGTTILLVITIGTIFFCNNILKDHRWPFIFFITATVLIAPYALKPYQRKRIQSFLGFGAAQKERYQNEQALIAIGSGGIVGKGLLCGTQNRLRFLPEGRTDFIIAIAAEEIGFLGLLFILFLYLILFWRIHLIIMNTPYVYAQLIIIGLATPIILSMIINVLMVLDLLPVVGMPLPLLSYGLTHLLCTFIALGIIQNIARNHHYWH